MDITIDYDLISGYTNPVFEDLIVDALDAIRHIESGVIEAIGYFNHGVTLLIGQVKALDTVQTNCFTQIFGAVQNGLLGSLETSFIFEIVSILALGTLIPTLKDHTISD